MARMWPHEYTLKATGGGIEIFFPIDFGTYLSSMTPSILVQSTRFNTTYTYTPSNDVCFHKLSLFLQICI